MQLLLDLKLDGFDMLPNRLTMLLPLLLVLHQRVGLFITSNFVIHHLDGFSSPVQRITYFFHACDQLSDFGFVPVVFLDRFALQTYEGILVALVVST